MVHQRLRPLTFYPTNMALSASVNSYSPKTFTSATTRPTKCGQRSRRCSFMTVQNRTSIQSQFMRTFHWITSRGHTSVAMNNRSGLISSRITLLIGNAASLIAAWYTHPSHSQSVAVHSETEQVRPITRASVKASVLTRAVGLASRMCSNLAPSAIGNKFAGIQPLTMARACSRVVTKRLFGTISHSLTMSLAVMPTPTRVYRSEITKSLDELILH